MTKKNPTATQKNKKEKIFIFDTTLRDGEQSPGFSMSVEQKLTFAKQLEKLNVDIIEAGFPVSSPQQFKACELIAKELTKPTITGLARTLKSDIDAVHQSLKKAKRGRIHTFIATSDIHIATKLNKTKKEVLKMAKNAVHYASGLLHEVEFSAEDATRSDINFLIDIVNVAIENGATIINVPDTVGYTSPEEYHKLIHTLKTQCDNTEKVIFSCHCHNDLGLAIANSISGVNAGARQVEVSVNGIGERAGNAALEEIVMLYKTRKDFFSYQTDINTKEIYPTSQLLSRITNITVQPNKAIVGKNAFAHTSGIHQHGIIKNRLTYEIMDPKSIGKKESELRLGKHSGKHGLTKVLEKLKVKYSKKEFEQIFNSFIEIADKKKYLENEDIIAIASEVILMEDKSYLFDNFRVYVHNSPEHSIADISLKHKGEVLQNIGTGDGPIAALYDAINAIIGIDIKIIEYKINAISMGRDAVGDVMVEITNPRQKKKTFIGHGYSNNIIEASVKAYLNAINTSSRK